MSTVFSILQHNSNAFVRLSNRLIPWHILQFCTQHKLF
jgi:hypothetical protein